MPTEYGSKKSCRYKKCASMRVKGFSLALRNKAKSRFNPTGELKTLVLRVMDGFSSSYEPNKFL